MCGVLKLICVLACLLVVPSTSQTQQDRRKGSHPRCRKPCFQEILKKLDKNGQGIYEVQKDVKANGERIEEVKKIVKENGQGIYEVKEEHKENAQAIKDVRDEVREMSTDIIKMIEEVLKRLDKTEHVIDEVKENVFENGEKIDEVINVHKIIKGKVFENGEKIAQVINMLDPNNTSGFIIAAGENPKGIRTTEKFDPFLKESCPAGDIPEPRQAPSFCNNLLCGGNSQDQSCLQFDGDSTWEPVSVQLNMKRSSHLCWGLPSGAVLLLGGKESSKTTELVSADRSISTPDFTLPYDTFYACGVEIGDKFIVTGGMNVSEWYYGINTVAEYSQSGFVQYLTPMNNARRSHACSTYVTDSGDTALLVAGTGNDQSGMYDGRSVEIMVQSTWSYAAPLPAFRFYAPAATLHNSVSVFGGAFYYDKSYNFFDEIFTYNAALNTWNITGHLSQPRSWHVVATLAVAGVCT